VRVNCEAFRRNTCYKCDKYTGKRAVFGKCAASMTDIYKCVSQMVAARLNQMEVPADD